MADRTDTFYAADEAIQPYGAQLLKGDGASPESFQAVAGVTRITPGAMTTEDGRRTHLRSPDAHHEHMPGMRDSAAFGLGLIWMPSDETQSNAGGGSGSFTGGGLIADWRARTIHNWKIRLNNGTSPALEWPFRGYVNAFTPGPIDVGSNDPITAEAGIMPTQAYDSSLP
jgi:hypothetical protein